MKHEKAVRRPEEEGCEKSEMNYELFLPSDFSLLITFNPKTVYNLICPDRWILTDFNFDLTLISSAFSSLHL